MNANRFNNDNSVVNDASFDHNRQTNNNTAFNILNITGHNDTLEDSNIDYNMGDSKEYDQIANDLQSDKYRLTQMEKENNYLKAQVSTYDKAFQYIVQHSLPERVDWAQSFMEVYNGIRRNGYDNWDETKFNYKQSNLTEYCYDIQQYGYPKFDNDTYKQIGDQAHKTIDEDNKAQINLCKDGVEENNFDDKNLMAGSPNLSQPNDNNYKKLTDIIRQIKLESHILVCPEDGSNNAINDMQKFFSQKLMNQHFDSKSTLDLMKTAGLGADKSTAENLKNAIQNHIEQKESFFTTQKTTTVDNTELKNLQKLCREQFKTTVKVLNRVYDGVKEIFKLSENFACQITQNRQKRENLENFAKEFEKDTTLIWNGLLSNINPDQIQKQIGRDNDKVMEVYEKIDKTSKVLHELKSDYRHKLIDFYKEMDDM